MTAATQLSLRPTDQTRQVGDTGDPLLNETCLHCFLHGLIQRQGRDPNNLVQMMSLLPGLAAAHRMAIFRLLVGETVYVQNQHVEAVKQVLKLNPESQQRLDQLVQRNRQMANNAGGTANIWRLCQHRPPASHPRR